MCKNDLSFFLNENYLSDVASRCSRLDGELAKAAEKKKSLREADETAVENIVKSLQSSLLVISDKLCEIDDKTQADIEKIYVKKDDDIAETDKRIEKAEAELKKTIAECDEKKAQFNAVCEKSKAEVVKKYKADALKENRRFGGVSADLKSEIEKTENEFRRRLDELKADFERQTQSVNEKIQSFHETYKNSENTIKADFEKTKAAAEVKMREKSAAFSEEQEETNRKIKASSDKQMIKTLRGNLALNKSGYEAEMAALKEEMSSAEKVFSEKRNEAFFRIVKEVTLAQKELRSIEAQYAYEKSKISYEQRISDAKFQNIRLEQQRKNAENLAETEYLYQDEMNKLLSDEFCGNYDFDVQKKEAQNKYEKILAEEEKNKTLTEFALQQNVKVVESVKIMADAEQNLQAEVGQAKADKEITTIREKSHHLLQTQYADIYSFAVKGLSKTENCLNEIRTERNTDVAQEQLEILKRRLEDDLSKLELMRKFQQAEFEQTKKTADEFFSRKTSALELLLATCGEDRTDEKNVVENLINSANENHAAAIKEAEAQNQAANDIFDREEQRLRKNYEEEAAALTSFISHCEEMYDKFKHMSDERFSKADREKKDAVVGLLEIFENNLARFESDFFDFDMQKQNAVVELDKAAVVEKELFIQEADDRKNDARKACQKAQAEADEKLEQYRLEAEKNKNISKGMLNEKLGKSLDQRQDIKEENVHLAAQKANELKAFENACNRALAECLREKERKINEAEKLRAKEEKWLLKNGKVVFGKKWWLAAEEQQ